MSKRATCSPSSQGDAALCAEVRQLSLESRLTEELGPSSGLQEHELSLGAADVGSKRLHWYDQLLLFLARSGSDALDWKAWANCGACLHQLGEKKASWDAYRQAALASRGFRVSLSDSELLADPRVGKYVRTLDREFCADGWASSESSDIAFFVLLVKQHRASEVATQRWHEALPNHYFSVCQALCRKLSTRTELLMQVHLDDSRMEMQRGNRLVLLGSPGTFFVHTNGSKRAKLQDCVRDIVVEVWDSSRVTILDFGVGEVEPSE